MAEIPECPITKLPLTDPVMDPEGNTYEKAAILAWLSQHGTSPITRTPLWASQLIPNRVLKDLIEKKNEGAKLDPNSAQLSLPYRTQPLKDEEIKVEMSITKDSKTIISIEGPNVYETFPVHICCVIDTSGSMGDLVSVNNESDGLTLLDIVKHATKVIIESLGPLDKISIVEFNSDSKCVLKPVTTTAEGKAEALKALEGLEANGGTMLAKGIKHAVEIARTVEPSLFTSIFLLTDGVPSESGLDYAAALNRQSAKSPIFGNFNTFGFGYNLNSQILRSIAFEGRGSFGFIPDAGMVGTVFINALANVRCTYAVDAAISISPPHESTVLGDYDIEKSVDCIKIKLAPLRFGQKSVVVIEKPGINVTLHANLINGQSFKKESVPSQLSDDEQLFHALRASLSSNLLKASNLNSISDAPKDLKLNDMIKVLRSTYSPVDSLAKDMEGQVAEALSRQDWYSRWGRHYLISLGFAHLRQQCNNFKDPGVQEYGKGIVFKKIQEELSDLFISLPAPVPTGRAYNSYGGGGGPSVPVDMSRYYNASAWCFDGTCPVEMADGSIREIRTLQKGDRLAKGAAVVCLIEIKVQGDLFMVELGNLQITPYHPIIYNGEWKFPVEIVEPSFAKVGSVFNVVVDKGHKIVIDGYDCVTLGHDFQDDVVRHPYFGSTAVLKDLEKLSGWENGFILLEDVKVERCRKEGIVTSMGTMVKSEN